MHKTKMKTTNKIIVKFTDDEEIRLGKTQRDSNLYNSSKKRIGEKILHRCFAYKSNNCMFNIRTK